MGHPEGNIIQVIKSFVLGSDIALKIINDLCSHDENSCSIEDNMLILKYIMDRYANMRGTYFVKFLSGTRKVSATDTQVASLATRTKVLSTVASSKAGAKSKLSEKALWDSAGDSVIQHSLYFDKLEVSE